MKYFLFSVIFHLAIFVPFHKNINTLGNPNFNKRSTVAISYNHKNLPERLDNIKNTKGSEEQQEVIKEVPKEVQEPKKVQEDLKSKIKKNEEKKEEKIEKKIEKPKKKKPTKEKKKPQNKPKQDPMKNGNFMANSDGSYTALSAKGLDFEILRQYDPDYPRQAEVIRYSKDVVVEARFLVGLVGNVEKIEIIKSHAKFGFDKEVIASLKKWKFKPIVYSGKKMKVYFTKEFIFKSKA